MQISRNTLVSVGLVGGLAIVAIAIAGNGEKTEAPKADTADAGAEELDQPARHTSQLCKRLRCTVDQDPAVLDLIENHRKLANGNSRLVKVARGKLDRLYAADELDDEAMRGIYSEIAELEGKIQLDAYQSIVTLHALLSPEQRVTFGRMLAADTPEQILGKPEKKGKRGGRDADDARAMRAARGAAAGRGDASRGAVDPARRDAAAGRREVDPAVLEARRAQAEAQRGVQ